MRGKIPSSKFKYLGTGTCFSNSLGSLGPMEEDRGHDHTPDFRTCSNIPRERAGPNTQFSAIHERPGQSAQPLTSPWPRPRQMGTSGLNQQMRALCVCQSLLPNHVHQQNGFFRKNCQDA